MKLLSFILIALVIPINLSAQSDFETSTIDLDFQVGSGFNSTVNDILLLSNGNLLVVGAFTEYNGTTANKIVLLNTDGSLDTDFNTNVGSTFSSLGTLYDVEVQSTGKIIVSHSAGDYLTRLDADGTPDATFGVIGTGFDSEVTNIAIQSDDKIIATGGFFEEYNGTLRNKIARLNSDGSLDTTFDPGSGIGTAGQFIDVFDVEVQTDDKILVGGAFTSFNGVTDLYAIRINSDGTRDNTYDIDETIGYVEDIYIKSNGNIVLAGRSGSSFGLVSETNATGEVQWQVGGTVPKKAITENPNGDLITIAYQEDQNIGNVYYLQKITSAGVNSGFSLFSTIVGSGVTEISIRSTGEILLAGNFSEIDGFTKNKISQLEECNSISIENQPQFTSVCEGETAVYSVTATGTNLTYQWQKRNGNIFEDLTDGGSVSGATTSELNITNVQAINTSSYRCVLTDDNCQTTTFWGVKLEVKVPTVITQDVQDLTVCEGETATFEVDLTGATGFQWQVDSLDGTGWQDLTDGTTSRIYEVDNVTNEMNEFKYRVILNGCDPPIVSSEAILTVTENPVIISAPEDVSLCSAGDVIYTVEASANGTLSYQWQYIDDFNNYIDLTNGGVYSGVTTPTLTLTNVDASLPEYASRGFQRYRCEVTANGCSWFSDYGNLSIYETPEITSQPENIELCNGSSSSTFFISTSANHLIQWQIDSTGNGYVDLEFNADFVNDGGNSQVSVKDITPEFDGWKFRAKVGDCDPLIYSDEVSIIVDTDPVFTNSLTQSTYTCEGSELILTGSAGDDVLYQWSKNTPGTSIFEDLQNDNSYSGVTSETLTINEVNENLDNTVFRLTATSLNGLCSTASSTTLNVSSTPSYAISSSLTPEICETESVVLSFSTSGFTYESNLHEVIWEVSFDGSNVFAEVSGDEYAVSTSQVITSLTISETPVAFDGNMYRIRVTGCDEDFISDTLSLIVNFPPQITSSPENVTICEGEDATFEIDAIGGGLTYQWEFATDAGSDFVEVSTAADSQDRVLVLSDVNAGRNGYLYRCIVSGVCSPSDTSVAAQLIVNQIEITEQPTLSSDQVCEGGEYSISIAATGEQLTYQWQRFDGTSFTSISDNNLYAGTTSETLVLQEVSVADDLVEFRCVVGGECPELISDPVAFDVTSLDIPEIASNSVSGGVELSVTNLSGDVFEWYLDGEVVQSSESNSYVATQPGDYSVIVYDGDCFESSEVFTVTAILSVIKENLIDLYPNPAIDFILINSVERINEIRIFGIDGKIFLSEFPDSKSTKIDISELKKGMYLINVETINSQFSKRVIKE